MDRRILIGLALLGLLGCRPHATGGAAMPEADSPASPAEPVSAPQSAGTNAAARDSGPYDLKGTEPFWSLAIRRDSLSLSRPDHREVLAVNAGPRLTGKRLVWEATAIATGGPLTITLEPSDCSDGMSDTRYPHRATVEFGGETLRGCARESSASG